MKSESKHRIFGFFRAPETAALWLILVFLTFFYLWSRLDPEKEKPTIPKGPMELEAQILTGENGFQLEVRVDRAAYVAVFLRPKASRGSRLFPRLGNPLNLPWPLSPGEEHLLPGPGESFLFDLKDEDALEIITRTDRVPENFDDLTDDEKTSTKLLLQRKAP